MKSAANQEFVRFFHYWLRSPVALEAQTFAAMTISLT